MNIAKKKIVATMARTTPKVTNDVNTANATAPIKINAKLKAIKPCATHVPYNIPLSEISSPPLTFVIILFLQCD